MGDIDKDGDLDIVGTLSLDSGPTWIYENNAANQITYTLTYDGLGVTNGAVVPHPYPGITAATVKHLSTDHYEAPFESVTFWNGVSPGNGYGNLTNVAVGPRGLPNRQLG